MKINRYLAVLSALLLIGIPLCLYFINKNSSKNRSLEAISVTAKSQRSADFYWTSDSKLKDASASQWHSEASGKILLVDSNEFRSIAATHWHAQILSRPSALLFADDTRTKSHLSAILRWGFMDLDLKQSSPLEPASPPNTLGDFGDQSTKGGAYGINLMASILNRAGWSLSKSLQLENQSEIFQSQTFRDIGSQGLHREMTCKFKSTAGSFTSICHTIGSLKINETLSNLFESTETLKIGPLTLTVIEEQQRLKIELAMQNLRKNLTSKNLAARNSKPDDLKTGSHHNETNGNKTNPPAEDLVAEIESLNGKSTEGQKTAVYLRAKSYLKSHQEVPSSWLQTLSNADTEDISFQIFAGAMAASGNALAQKELVTLLVSATDGQKAEQLVSLLGFTKNPTADMLTALIQFGSKTQNSVLKNQTIMALGTLANDEYGSEAQERNKMITFLKISLNSPDTEQVIAALAALGNAAHPTTWQLIGQFTLSKHLAVKKQAFLSLRKAPWNEVSSYFASGLQDRNDAVLLSALKSLDLASPPQNSIAELLLQEMRKWSVSDHSEIVWRTALGALNKHGKNLTTVRSTLNELSQSLRSDSLRQWALTLLRS